MTIWSIKDQRGAVSISSYQHRTSFTGEQAVNIMIIPLLEEAFALISTVYLPQHHAMGLSADDSAFCLKTSCLTQQAIILLNLLGIITTAQA